MPNSDILSSFAFHPLINPSTTVLVIYRWVIELTTTFSNEEQMTSGFHGKTMPNGTVISSRDMNNTYWFTVVSLHILYVEQVDNYKFCSIPFDDTLYYVRVETY